MRRKTKLFAPLAQLAEQVTLKLRSFQGNQADATKYATGNSADALSVIPALNQV